MKIDNGILTEVMPEDLRDNSFAVPYGVKVIGKGAFEKCKSIKRLKLPNSIEIIDEEAFNGNMELPEIVLPEQKFDEFDEYYDDFNEKVGLDSNTINALRPIKGRKRVRIPEQINYLANIGCLSELEEINVDENNQFFSSNDGVLYSKDGKNLIMYPKGRKNKEYSVPEGTTVIEDNAFAGCNYIEQIFLPDSLKKIKHMSFCCCKNLKRVEIPNNVVELGFATFKKCKNLEYVKLPDMLKSISPELFRECRNLKEVNIPSELEAIADMAFIGCPEETKNKILQYKRANKIKTTLDSDWEKDGEQIWVNLSDRKFEQVNMNDRQEHNNASGLKPTVGTWFALLDKEKMTSEWESADACGYSKYSYKTTAKLKESAYVVELGRWKDVIQNVLENTDINMPIVEKRKILLNRIRKELGDDNIEHLIFHVKESDWPDINSLYYQQSGDVKEWEKINFIMGNLFKYDDSDSKTLNLEENNVNFIIENFETYKSIVALRIKLLKLINSGEIQMMNYQGLERYLSESEKKMLRFLHYGDIVSKLDVYKKSYQMNSEILEEYEKFINKMESADDFREFITKYKDVENYGESSWFFDYFSGCVAKDNVEDYDVNSLVIFDTSCLNILKNEPLHDQEKELSDDYYDIL